MKTNNEFRSQRGRGNLGASLRGRQSAFGGGQRNCTAVLSMIQQLRRYSLLFMCQRFKHMQRMLQISVFQVHGSL